MKKYYLVLFVLLIMSPLMYGQTITTIVGDTVRGYNGDNIAATAAHLKEPSCMAVDSRGNIYIADDSNFRIRRVDPAGIITTFAGNGVNGITGDGGPATAAEINPFGIAADKFNNVYFTDMNGSCIRKIDASGTITLFAGIPDSTSTTGSYGDGGPATSALLNEPSSLAVDTFGNVYVADVGHKLIRKIDLSGVISTFAGGGFSTTDGPATAAYLDAPAGIAVDAAQNLYTVGFYNGAVQKIDTHGMLTTITGPGVYNPRSDTDGVPATAANFSYSGGIAADASGNLYIVDALHFKIAKISASLYVSHIAGDGHYGYTGDGGPATAAMLADLNGIAIDNSGNILIGDYFRSTVRRINISTEAVNSVANSAGSLRVWPNPTHTSFFVFAASDYPEAAHVTIINAVGQKVKQLELGTNVQQEIKVNCPPGNYYVVAEVNGKFNTQSLVLLE